MQKIKKLAYKLLILVSMMFISCGTVFQYPGDIPLDPTLVNLNLNLVIDIESVEDFKEYDGTQSLSKSEMDEYQLRTILEIYDTSNSDEPIIRECYYSPYTDIEEYIISQSFKLNARKYNVLVWADVVESKDDSVLYYVTSDLNNIVPVEPYSGATDLKHCFAKSKSVDLIAYRDEWDVEVDVEVIMERPLARYEIISNDFEEFYKKEVASRAETAPDKVNIDFSKYEVQVHYDGFMPYGYSTYTDLPNKAEVGIEFTTLLEPLTSTTARVAFDHLFVNHSESTVNVSIVVYNELGALVTQVNSITIPAKRNRRSIIEGDFLTRDYIPGIAVDPSFDGDIDIWVD